MIHFQGPLNLTMLPKERKRQYTNLLAMREKLAGDVRRLKAQTRTREAAIAEAELRAITHKIMKWENK